MDDAYITMADPPIPCSSPMNPKVCQSSSSWNAQHGVDMLKWDIDTVYTILFTQKTDVLIVTLYKTCIYENEKNMTVLPDDQRNPRETQESYRALAT